MLDEMYPLRNPEPDEPVSRTQRHAGQRDVVEHLIGMLDDTERKALAANMKAG